MTAQEEEDLYVHFYEMGTDELVSISWTDLSENEHSIWAQAIIDRRNEIGQLIAEMRADLDEQENQLRRTVRLPAEIIAKLLTWEAAHNTFSSSSLDGLTDSESVIF